MSLDPQEVFRVMRCAYRNGVLEKFTNIQGDALEVVIAETGWNLGDLLNRMDEADEATVMKIDKLLDRVGPLIKYLDNDRLMKLTSRILDIPFVRKMMVRAMAGNIIFALDKDNPPTAADKLKYLVGKAA